MQIHKIVLAATSLLVAGQATALDPKGFQVVHTGQLVELCSVSVEDPYYDAAMGFCYGYIDAAMDYHAALTAGDKYAPIVCPDAEVTREEVVVILLTWSKNNASYMDGETPVHGVIRAASAKWPCPTK